MLITMSSYKAMVSFTGDVSETRQFLDDLVSAVKYGGTESSEKVIDRSTPSDGNNSSSGVD